eukprot:CAMPEP_0171312972 /NCGR_PEP_ID=MMETSP0816-20121228/35944_1 /TAXON_ID=420281 /ORGANISM="Proboscia inermis, Strain CCAP1064/1" /LENGTH=69 /DNA_ID=CAMNT_0011799563 /DNA_START=193 /DNA_END=402 /DNA_ORIENTATION=+
MQPFYMPGIADLDQAKSSAKGSVAMFVFALIASIFAIYKDDSKGKEQIENGEGEYLNAGAEDYGSSRFD